jgi:hypothetical protein
VPHPRSRIRFINVAFRKSVRKGYPSFPSGAICFCLGFVPGSPGMSTDLSTLKSGVLRTWTRRFGPNSHPLIARTSFGA